MIAVSYSDYDKYGCTKCGCAFCYTNGVSSQESTLVTCGECNNNFVILGDGVKKSSSGYKLNGEEEFTFPVLSKHPREGILKHAFVRPDVRPENGKGDFCEPRGVGYDVACFVKSKQAGERITSMINRVCSGNKEGFVCHLDYRENEPLWIQVKIDYPSELRAHLLIDLIKKNNNVIDEDIVLEAMNKQIDLETYYRYSTSLKIREAYSWNFIEGVLGKFGKLDEEETVYKLAYGNTNYLDQFEMFGLSKQIDIELQRGNLEGVKILLKHGVDISNSEFNVIEYSKIHEKKPYLTETRSKAVSDMSEALKKSNILYRGTKSECYKNIYISEEEKVDFVNEWNVISASIFDVVNMYVLKCSVSDKKAHVDTVNNSENFYIMCSLYGLYVYVNRQIELGNFEDAILAIKHVAEQRKMNLIYRTTDKRIVDTYLLMDILAIKYYKEKSKKLLLESHE